ncbi:flavin reductase family protein [Risungbinella massiliensis]|uniref:flavin reductase family protein n=1 Tax=Risungbinella massiliensis TaxID=1329796 RepID=UPI0005CB81D2|nr:flavin reductase family protein [Risungbinella massiliensis]
MKSINPTDQTKQDNYKLLIGTVLPRPIAFVTSKAVDGTVNAAPFSFYTVVSTEPPMIGFTVNRKPGGVQKDTSRNIVETGEFVVHVVTEQNVQEVNETATDFPADVSEAEKVGFTFVPSEEISVPRIVESPIQMECILHQVVELGGTAEAPNSDFLIGEVVRFHVAEELYEQGRIDTEKLAPVGRLAGTTYGKIGKTFSMPRMSVEQWEEYKKK